MFIYIVRWWNLWVKLSRRPKLHISSRSLAECKNDILSHLRSCKFSDPENEVDLILSLAGVPAELDPPRFGPPGPNLLADMDPLRIWTPNKSE